MKPGRHHKIAPSTAIALLALFFALGGSAFALSERIESATATQKRCANGAVRGFATVTGNPTMGIANVPDTFTSSGVLFSRKFNCTGRAVQVRRISLGVFEIRFVGNSASTAVAGGFGNAYATVDPAEGGGFRVSVHPAGRDDPADQPFVIVVV